MGETKHTPGPWEVLPPDGARPSRATVSAANGCDIYDAPLTRETEANARLIAAAPEMYEALRDLARVACLPAGTDPEILVRAFAALARAEAR